MFHLMLQPDRSWAWVGKGLLAENVLALLCDSLEGVYCEGVSGGGGLPQETRAEAAKRIAVDANTFFICDKL